MFQASGPKLCLSKARFPGCSRAWAQVSVEAFTASTHGRVGTQLSSWIGTKPGSTQPQLPPCSLGI
eukprot:8602596-Alexandrium_andersonii.AAC.1